MKEEKYRKDQPKPLLRAFARTLDYCFFYSLFILPLFFASIIPHDRLHLAIMVLIPLFWVPIEAFFITATGTTPGKALIGIHIRNDLDQKLSLKTSFQRALCVWIKGLSLNIFPINIFSSLYQFKKLKKHNSTSWDKTYSVNVFIKKKRKFRTLLSGILVFLYALFFFSEYELRDVLISDQKCLSSKMFTKQEGKWVLFKDPAGKFHIDFPATPETSEKLIPTTSGKDPLPLSEVKLLSEEVEYSLSYITLPRSITKWSSGLVLKGSLKLLAKHLHHGAKICKKSSSKYKKHPAIEFILEKKGHKESMGRLILIGSSLYKIEVTYSSDKRELIQENLSIFMQSFEPKG